MSKRVPKKWFRNPSDEKAVAEGYWFDEAAGQFVIDFIETLCKQSQGEWAGQPIKLLDWQKDFIYRLYGWKKPNGLRRFKSAYLEVAKKNGKSTLCSALVLYHLVADGEAGAKVFIGAYDGEQAKTVYEESVAMVEQSPALESRLDIQKRDHRIAYLKTRSFATILTSDAKQKEGKNASFIIFDELHTQRSRKFWASLRWAFAARKQPLRISITTASDTEDGVWYEERTYSEKINRGELINLTHLGVVYRAEKTDDFDDEKTWLKANPSLGHTITFESFKDDLESAKQKPAEWAEFLRYRFNVITNADTVWLDPDQWKQCGSVVEPRDFLNREIAIGLDLSETTDLCAAAFACGNEEEGVEVWIKFWMPKDRVQTLSEEDNVPYQQWVDEGFIETTPGKVIDYKWIRKAILEAAGQYQIKVVNSDPWNARQFLIDLRDEHGIEVCETRQGFTSMHPLIVATERLILDGKLRHGNNPVLNWMVSNAVVRKNEDGLMRLVKPKKGEEKEKASKGGTKGRIDGVIALVLGTGALIVDGDLESEASHTSDAMFFIKR